MKKKMKDKVLLQTFKKHFWPELGSMEFSELERFRDEYTFFLFGKSKDDIAFEFCLFHFQKWVERLKLPISQDVSRAFLYKKLKEMGT
jgi:hypothetical protein